MFPNVFSSALTLRIRDQGFKFKSPRDLEFALSGKSSPSSGNTAVLVRLTDAELVREVDRLKQMEQRLAGALSAAADGAAGAVAELFAELDMALVHEDHDWRELLGALRRVDGNYGAYREVALAKYVQYLRSAQELIRAVFSERRRAGGEAAAPELEALAANEIGPRQSLAFSIADLLGREPARGEFNRLPKGEAIGLELEPHQSLCVMLAKHRFTLVSGTPWLLVDATGDDRQVRRAECLVGRHPDADIVVHAGYRSVSRNHLLIETEAETFVKLTDVSSLGTFVPIPNLYALKL